MSRLKLAVFFGLLVAGACAAAQPAAQPWSAVQATARKEARVALYAQLQAPVLERLKASFEKNNPGVVLESNRIFGPALVTKVDAERKAGVDGADVIITSDTQWFEERAKEVSLKQPAGPAARSWPGEYLLSGAVPIFAVDVLVIAYNTNLVKTPVTGLQDLTRPEFKGGRIATTPGTLSRQGAAWYDWLEKTQGSEFLARFGAQEPRLIASAAPTTQAVASGEVAITPWSLLTIAIPLSEQGAPIKIVVPQPTMGFPYGAGALGWSRRPNAALVLLDYLMSPAAAAVMAGRGEMATPLAGIPGAITTQNMKLFNARELSEDYVNAFRKKWTTLFQKQG